MELVQTHPHSEQPNPRARLLAYRTARLADEMLRRQFYERQRTGRETQSLPVEVATPLAILYFGLGWLHAEMTRLSFDATNHRSIIFLRGIMVQGITMCSDLSKIINEWSGSTVTETLWAQYTAAKRLQTDLSCAIVAIEERSQEVCQ
jgi:hypothetical protein